MRRPALLILLLATLVACTEDPAVDATPSVAPPTTACRATPTGPETFAYTRHPGVDELRTSLDVYLPATCGPAPVIVWVHGGGWRTGDKRHAIDGKIALAQQLGAALIAVNYRLSSEGPDVMWPDHGDDVASALAWIRDEGPRIDVDPERVVLIGHSAGGHLVSIVATDPDLAPAGEIVECVVTLDTEGYDLAQSAAAATGLVANAFGTDPEVVADASPLVQVERRGAPRAEFLVVTRGLPRRRALAQEFVDALVTRGGTAEVLDAGTYTHADVNRRLGEAGEQVVTPAVRGFVERCGFD